jgi:hypothetical protein
MRTTLTLDRDVAVLVERLRRERDASLKDVVNDALRRGLREMSAPAKRRKPFRTKTYDGGKLLVPSIDNVAELLAEVEGEGYK